LVKLDKIYTRGGDTGTTSLGNGERVKKDSLRVKSYGEVDEINAIIGVITCYCSNGLKKKTKTDSE
jgi:cob(I)alamin adenosyltransferase